MIRLTLFLVTSVLLGSHAAYGLIAFISVTPENKEFIEFESNITVEILAEEDDMILFVVTLSRENFQRAWVQTSVGDGTRVLSKSSSGTILDSPKTKFKFAVARALAETSSFTIYACRCRDRPDGSPGPMNAEKAFHIELSQFIDAFDSNTKVTEQ